MVGTVGAATGAGEAVASAAGLVIGALILSILTIVGAAMILAKKKVGVFLFFVSVAIGLVIGWISNGFKMTDILGLILPGLMFIFIKQDKEVFGL